MSVRSTLKRSDAIVGVVRDTKKLIKAPAQIARLVKRNEIITSYMARHQPRKLELGSGPTRLDGWLSTDIAPRFASSAYLDATRRFPLQSDAFDYIYSEHLIEHLSQNDGLFMLRECRRVLKPGGTIRIATPNLEVITGLCNWDGNAMSRRYIDWITDKFIDGVDVYRACFVVNNAFYNWGHRFLYDAEVMELTMDLAGFTDIRRCAPGESSDEHLRGIESHGERVSDPEMAAFETMVFEARCPD